jgi:hypothetical protein
MTWRLRGRCLPEPGYEPELSNSQPVSLPTQLSLHRP